MFEKEAEEYAIGLTYPKFQDDQIANIVLRDVKGAFQKGAELGYNKANEWHKVSDRLPPMEKVVYLWHENGSIPVCAYRHTPYGKTEKDWVWECYWGSGYTLTQFKAKDYLWKEIVLPAEEYRKDLKSKFFLSEPQLDLACQGFKDGYNKAKEEIKHDLMMKLKDEGIVKPLKDSIMRNERLSSQEQQELCAWIECAMDFGENLDECAKELEEVNKANEWRYPSKGELPPEDVPLLCIRDGKIYVAWLWDNIYHDSRCWQVNKPYAWKEIVLP